MLQIYQRLQLFTCHFLTLTIFCIIMYLFDLKQKFTSKHPMPFTKAVGYFKSFSLLQKW